MIFVEIEIFKPIWWYARVFVFFIVKIKPVAMLLTESVEGSFVLLRLSQMFLYKMLKIWINLQLQNKE